jgi:HEPN domain-containing protein
MHGNRSNRSLEELDEELKDAGTPLRYRPLDCFKKMFGSVPDGTRRQELFDPIIEWYIGQYGDAARWDGIVARFPISIGGVVYLGRVRFVAEGEVLANFEDEIEDLPKDIARSLSPEEMRSALEKLTFGSRNFHSLYNLLIDDDCLAEIERGLVRRALYDLENAAVTLKHTGDTQAATVLAHEAAEKFLKAALQKSGNTKKLTGFGHDIPKVFQALLQAERRYAFLSSPIANLQKLSPNMELRYSNVPRSMEMAIQAYHGALYICGMIAQMWLFDKARGTSKSRFRECYFYLDGANSTFYCKRVQGVSVTLTLFRSSRFIGSQMVDITLDMAQSALYLEVTDTRQDAQLRSQLMAHLRNPGRKVFPEEIGLKMVHGPEGSYATAMIRRPIAKPNE